MIIAKSFNGFVLNSSDYLTTALSAITPPDAVISFVEQINADPSASGAFTREAKTIVLGVRILDYANRDALEAQLKEATMTGTRGTLVGTFSDEMRDYQVEATVQSCRPDSKYPYYWQITLRADESAWQSVDEVEDSNWACAGGGSRVLSVGGYSKTRLSVDLTVTSLPATGWAYRNRYQLINHPDYAFGVRPWCIALNTSALVTTGKMMASCYDLRVIVDGKSVNRWIASPNTSASKIWFNLAVSQGCTLVLKTAIASSGAISKIQFEKSKNSRTSLKRIARHGFFVHGTEWIEYRGVNSDDCYVKVVGRGVYDTTLQAHNAGVSFTWMEHAIMIIYGHTSTTSPDATDSHYDDTKPMFDLVNSDNGQFLYTTTTGFYDKAYPGRTGQFRPSISRVGNESNYYAIYNSTLAANGGMGMQMASWYKGGKIQTEKAAISWEFSWPGLINNVSMTGRKYRSTANWAGSDAVRLEYSFNKSKWYTSWSEGTPSSALSWQAITKNSQDTKNSPHMRFALVGTLPASVSENDYEVLSCTLDLVDASNPTGSLLGEMDNILLDFSITNSSNDDAIKFYYPIRLNKTLYLDGELFEAQIGSAGAYESANACFSLDDDSRDVWLRLEPGSNTLVVSGDTVPAMTVKFHWKDRRR